MSNLGHSPEAAHAATFVTAGVSSATLVAENTGRTQLIVSNDHATQVAYLALATASDVPAGPQPAAPTAVVGSGIRVGPGQTYTLQGFSGAVGVIASGAATNICVQEV